MQTDYTFHIGESVERAMDEKKIQKGYMADQLGISRAWLGVLLGKRVWEEDYLKAALRVLKLKRDELELFSKEREDMTTAKEPPAEYTTLLNEKERYILRLEKENDLKAKIIEKWIAET